MVELVVKLEFQHYYIERIKLNIAVLCIFFKHITSMDKLGFPSRPVKEQKIK